MKRLLIIAALALVSCGSDTTGIGNGDSNPTPIDVSNDTSGIVIRRVFVEGNDTPVLCIIYRKGSDSNGGHGYGAGISCDWVGWGTRAADG